MGMVVINCSREDESPTWKVWREVNQPPLNGKSIKWVLRCSFCSVVVESAIAIPEDGIRICSDCIRKMNNALNAPSGGTAGTDQNDSDAGCQGAKHRR